MLPAFEVATLWVAAATIYAAFPLVNFIAGGLRWTMLADQRLLWYESTASDVGTFAWRYVLHIASFIAAYLVVRGRASVPRGTVVLSPGKARVAAILIFVVAVLTLLFVIGKIYGVSYAPKYRDAAMGEVQTISVLPFGLLQIVQNVAAMRLLLWQMLVALLLMKWRSIWARVLLAAFMGLLLMMSFGAARTSVVLTLLSAMLLYHRLVRPLTLQMALLAGTVLVGGFMILGVFRDLRGVNMASYGSSPLTSMNEFQAIFGTAYDLHERRLSGELTNVPWQVKWADVLAVVPSQLLPFPKIDPSLWYMNLIGVERVGLMFGVIAQCVVGRDWIELALRGAALGIVFALLHRWYVRRADRFWPNILNVFVAVWSYYCIRQSSFAFVYFFVFRFVPVFIGVEVIRYLISVPQRRVMEAWRRRRSKTV
jgi:hypothetical protein